MKTTWRISQGTEIVTFEVRWSPEPVPIPNHEAHRKSRQSSDSRPKQRTERRKYRGSSAKRRSRRRLLDYQVEQLRDGQSPRERDYDQGAPSNNSRARTDGEVSATSGSPHVTMVTPPHQIFAPEPVVGTARRKPSKAPVAEPGHRKLFPIVHFEADCMDDTPVLKVNTGSQPSPHAGSTQATQYSPPLCLSQATQISPSETPVQLAYSPLRDTHQQPVPPPGIHLPLQYASPPPGIASPSDLTSPQPGIASPLDYTSPASSELQDDLIAISLTPSSRVLSIPGLDQLSAYCVLCVKPHEPVWRVLQQIQNRTGLQYPIVLWDSNLCGHHWMVSPETEIGHQINLTATGNLSYVYDLNPNTH
jgi:hypothetical protein